MQSREGNQNFRSHAYCCEKLWKILIQNLPIKTILGNFVYINARAKKFKVRMFYHLPGGFLSGGFLAWGVFVPGFLLGGYVRGVFVLIPI